jgi:hypothetical protein
MKYSLLISAALISVPASAYADEALKVRLVTHVVAAQSQDVGDADGHTMSVGRGSGLVSFPDGSVGSGGFVSAIDYIKGSGQVLMVYMTIGAADGSQIWIKATGSAQVQGNKSELKASGSIVGGTGKFSGVKGDASWTSERFSTQFASGSELYTDVTLNIKK